ncbi:hypothetical protein F2Q69_00061299 [Brassica cretica]|uniref:Serine-threonine/tyrosine-protein kinase catalytic domain-containing protein n=1 Tax=Brassica cretica TaxID=69181 RepID=A0A8S9RKK0_BRACR|nr:hypothetical protein F2Q69_00061299 [Brassica cretica]
MLKRYSYTRVKKMTNSFANALGKGGFGTVYKGKLPDGNQDVAVKILKESKGNGEEFINEVASMSRTSHHCDAKRDEEWRLFNHKASHTGQHLKSTCPHHRKTNSKEPRGKEHVGSTTRSHELEGSSTSSRGEDDAGDPHLPLPALPKSFVRGVTRVKQRGNPYPLARRRSVIEDPTLGR